MFQRALKSSKFQAALAGLVALIIVALVNRQHIDMETVSALITALIVAYIGATAYEDGQKAKAEAAPTTTVSTPAENVTVTATDAKPRVSDAGRVGVDG